MKVLLREYNSMFHQNKQTNKAKTNNLILQNQYKPISAM